MENWLKIWEDEQDKKKIFYGRRSGDNLGSLTHDNYPGADGCRCVYCEPPKTIMTMYDLHQNCRA